MLFAADNFIAEKIIKFAEAKEIEIYLIDIKKHKSSKLAEEYGDHYYTYQSLEFEELQQIIKRFSEKNIKFDYLIFNYYFDELRTEKMEFLFKSWDDLLEEWILNSYLIFKNVYPFLNKKEKSRVIYFNSARGYTGDNCPSFGGDFIEAGLSGALTGVMTSIAREIIPEGISVNSIALADDYLDKWPKIEWVLNLWLSGMAEYSCAESVTIR
ncbi:MAG: hypothetical protein ACOC17_03450 [Halanaerobium sp.]